MKRNNLGLVLGRGERNSLAVISFFIGAANVFVFSTALLMSQMV